MDCSWKQTNSQKLFHVILIISCCFCLVVNGKECTRCEDAAKVPVCGADKQTYPSFCALMRQECLQDKLIGFECDGTCPCDPVELKKMDERTVNKLAELRRDLQLESHIPDMELDNNSDNIVTLEVLGDSNEIKKFKGEEDKGYLKSNKKIKEVTGCSTAERLNLPSRLIDWFHVLRANEQETINHQKGHRIEPVLREVNFMDGKLKAMYSRLACADNNEAVEKEVCLSPVKWMFKHLDKNNDDNLSPVELLEIENLNNEQCIKPFLQSCDSNHDKKVLLKEFCRCLCHTPPCSHALESIPTVLINGRAKPLPGKFTPKCDQDGFFMPKQVNILKNEHWCVDRNGAEIDGSRKSTTELIHCDINTRPTDDVKPLIPLDMQKENEAPQK